MKGLLVLTALCVAVFGKKTFEGNQVLQITAKDEAQISLLKELSEQEHLELDFWREPIHESLPVDVHVPFHNLQDVKKFLGNNQIQYDVMIMDVQVGLLIKLFDYMLVAENRNLVSKIVIGSSYEKRPLNVLKVGHDE
uniref:Carboxypeptidase A1-like n=1 Tax=Cyprinus carpio TaxID=7962 RepID=A0A8C1NIB9_CYPCA